MRHDGAARTHHQRRHTEPQAAKLLNVTTSRVSDLVQGKMSQFGLDELVRMVVAAGLIVSDEAAAAI